MGWTRFRYLGVVGALGLWVGCANRAPATAPASQPAVVASPAPQQPGQPARAPQAVRQGPPVPTSASKAVGMRALEDELRRAMSELGKRQEISPYYIGYEVHDRREIDISASDGALTGSTNQRSRVLTTDVRVGDHKLDSTHPFQGFELNFEDMAAATAALPLDDAPAAIRAVAWASTDKRYKAALERFLKIKAEKKLKVASDDPSDDFSSEAPVTFIEPAATVELDTGVWEGRIRRLSARFAAEPNLRWSQARLEVKSINRWLANSEGTSIQTGRNYVRVFLQATLRADDGADLVRHESFDAADLAHLPDEAALAQAADVIVADLRALRRAPVAEPYTGPAVLEGKAAAVFFHETFGHRVEGHRQKNDQEGQTFAKKVGEAIMPPFISVYDDPQLVRIGDEELNGYYRFDDEGVAGQPTPLVDRGVLKGFLMGRSPTRGFAHSNGHGRRTEGRNVVARQGNLVVQPALAVSVGELRERLRQEARRQGKAYGLLFKDISGGFTNTERAGPQAFKVLPILVYRVWVDGRPDELVRGADVVGTPLASLSKIIAASDDYQTFNGYCGAESGFVPVSATSPSLLVQQIEVERKSKGSEKAPILQPPTEDKPVTGDAAVRQALKDELDRSVSDLRIDDQPHPYFAAFTTNGGSYVQVGATLGSVTMDVSGRSRSLRVDLRVGDPALDNTNLSSAGYGAWHGGNYATLPLDDNYRAIRRTLWLVADGAYKTAANDLAKKKAAAGGQVAREEDKVPDFSKQAPSTTISLPVVREPDAEPLRRIVSRLSGLFQDYPTVATSRATAMDVVGRQSLLDSEGTWADERDGFVRVDVSAGTQAEDGMHVRNTTSFTAKSAAELPSDAAMEKEVRAMASTIDRMAKAAIPDGGDAIVLFEGRAAGQIVKRLLADQLSGTPSPKVGGGFFSRAAHGFSEKLGQRVAADLLSAYDDPRQELGPGKQLLLGSYHADDEGVPAQRVSLIENGILKSLLMSRTPSKDIPQSNGHGRASRGSAVRGHIGNLFVTTKGGLSRKALLAKLAKESKARHCHAYVVRLIEDPTTGGSFDPYDMIEELTSVYVGGGAQVLPLVAFRLKDGKEEPVRGFTVEGLLPKALKDIVAAGNEPTVLSFIDGYGGMGIASAIVTPSLMFSNLEVRRQKAHHRKPPLYPHPSFAR